MFREFLRVGIRVPILGKFATEVGHLQQVCKIWTVSLREVVLIWGCCDWRFTSVSRKRSRGPLSTRRLVPTFNYHNHDS